jgi:acetolactate synthase-1/2/3 large subunit
MKLSNYVAHFLAGQGIRHVFAITGGASLHLIDSLARTPGTTYICPQHEQAGAMAADAYARVTGGLGAAVATSGPGATNMLTGVACAYFDSVPVLYITGQVATFRMRRNSGVRQIGFQETDTVAMCKPITKYAVLIEDARKIRYELEKAVFIATSGRPGPVVVDIPDDLQRAQIDPDRLEAFSPPAASSRPKPAPSQIAACLELLAGTTRPVFIIGWGIRLARAEQLARSWIDRSGIPVLPTWAMADMLPASHPQLIGTFGTHGTRFGNFAVQNADLLLAVGARLGTRETGSFSTFAREAKKIIVDIDRCELNKFAAYGMKTDLLINADAREFLQAIVDAGVPVCRPNLAPWVQQINRWKAKYPVCRAEYRSENDVNPYVFVDALSDVLPEGETIFLDTGCAVAWVMQGFRVKPGQRIFHDFNNTAMGYALPASIGASLALGGKSVTCVVGDGSLQMNIQELATVVRHNLPVKILLINNHGYSMVQQTQDQWLNSRYEGTTVEGGLAFPDFAKVAEAYGFKTMTVAKNQEVRGALDDVARYPGPVLCNLEIPAQHRVIPQTKYGRAIEDAEPLLDRSEFLENMIVHPDKASLGDAA